MARIGIRSIKNAWIIWRNTSSFNARTENIQNALCVCVCLCVCVDVVILILHSSSTNKTYAVCVCELCIYIYIYICSIVLLWILLSILINIIHYYIRYKSPYPSLSAISTKRATSSPGPGASRWGTRRQCGPPRRRAVNSSLPAPVGCTAPASPEMTGDPKNEQIIFIPGGVEIHINIYIYMCVCV